MKPLLIYAPQNGEFFKTVLDGMTAFIGTETFQTAMDIGFTLAICMVGYQFLFAKKIESILRFFTISFIVVFALFGLKVPVSIIDMQYSEGAGPALTVDNVPLGVALPASLISGLGYGITQGLSDSFNMPNDLEYNRTGMIFGARTWLAATSASLSMSPDVAQDLSSFIRQCIFAAKLLGSQQISPQDLVHSKDLIKLYFKHPSPIYRVILSNGDNLSCIDAANDLKKRLPAASIAELKHLNSLMTFKKTDNSSNKLMATEEKDNFSSSLEAAHKYYMNISTSAAEIMTQNILINATRAAAADAFAFHGADAALMNYTNSTSMQKMNIAEANSFWLASYRLPMVMSSFWLLTICIFPLVLLLSLFPLTQNVYLLFLQSQAYLWSWPPMFVIIHFLVSLMSSHQITIFGKKIGGVSFSNIDALTAMHSNFAYIAGGLAASVPFLAYFITKGLSAIISSSAQHLGGMAQSLSVSEAQAIAQGNISMASYSGWNMNYNNTNANKFDTNHSHMSGRATVQTANGALLSEMDSGARIGNVQPAISSAAVSVHGSERVIDSLNDSANESFANASHLRTAADHQLQAGLNELKNFNTQDSNEYRSGEGLTNTISDSYSDDLRKMQDAVTNYNHHHEKNHQISGDLSGALRFKTDSSIWGKGTKWVSGMSGDLALGGRVGMGYSSNYQEFFNSNDGKAFNESFNHLITTAKNNHLDANDSHNLSKQEQIAAHFTENSMLNEQAAAEYTHGKQLQQAATHAREHGSNIDSNLNQAYHNWVRKNYGSHGENVLLQTDERSINLQNSWANKFLNSDLGKSAISSQVEHILQQNTGLKTEYQMQSTAVKKENSSEIYLQYARKVDEKTESTNLKAISSKQLERAKELQTHNHNTNIANDAETTKQVVELQTQWGKNDINNDYVLRQLTYNRQSTNVNNLQKIRKEKVGE